MELQRVSKSRIPRVFTVLVSFFALVMQVVFAHSESMPGESLPELGDLVPAEVLAEHDLCYEIISSSTIAPVYRILCNGISFSMGFNREQRVCYIATSDSAFATPEGIRVGSSYGAAMMVTDSILIKEPGWGYHVGLPSGWRAVFAAGSTPTEKQPDESTKVVFFFKRG